MNGLAKKFKKVRARLIQDIDNFPEDKREVIIFDKWSLKNILSHLSGWASYQINTLQRLKRGEDVETPKNLKASINEDLVSQQKDWVWDRVYQEFLKLSGELSKEYENLPKRMRGERIYNDKETTVKDFVEIEINHYDKTHGPQIKGVLKNLNVR